MPIHALPFLLVFGDSTPRWDTTSTKLSKVKSTGHSSVLIMLVSVVVFEKLHGQKGGTKKKMKKKNEFEYENEFLGNFDIF